MAIFPEALKVENPFMVVEEKSGRIVFASKQVSTVLGIPLDKLLNSHLNELEASLVSSRVMTSKELRNEMYTQIITTGEYSYLFLNNEFAFQKRADTRCLSPFVIAIIEPSAVISRVSGSFEELSGYKRWEIENKKNFLEFVSPPMREILKALHVLRYSKEYLSSDEYALEILRKDGTKRAVLAKIEFISATKQSIVFLVDINDQKAIEELMRKRLKFAGALGRIILGILSHREGNLFQFLCEELEKYKKNLKYKKLSIFLGKNGELHQMSGEPEKTEVFDKLRLCAKALEPGDDFVVLPSNDPHENELVLPVFFKEKLYAVMLFHGWQNELLKAPESHKALKAFKKAIEYRIEIKKTTETLKEQEEKMLFLLKFHESGIWEAVVDENGVHYRNDFQWLMALGYSGEDLRTKTWNSVIVPRDQGVLKKGIREYVTGKTDCYQVSYRVIDSRGAFEWFQDEGRFYKSFEGERILIGIRRKVTKSMLAWERLKYISFHDKLTGLYNRSFFEEEMARLDSERQVPLSIIMGDVNGLKLVNDAFGHAKGDELLKRSADILKGSVRREDVVARWGGDEFIILLPKADENIARSIVERIKSRSIQELTIENIWFSISLGYATRRDLSKTISALIKEAEDLMYRNKVLESDQRSRTVLTALENALFEYNPVEAKHCKRVEELALKFGEKLKIHSATMANLRLLARYHDIGKLAVPSNIIMKKGKLNKNEMEVVKSHPAVGFRIARSTIELSPISEEILCHHENWDGTGYPRKLKGEHIPYLARIIAVVNAFEAMTNFRPYREALSVENALHEIEKCSGTQFDPYIAAEFVEFVKESRDCV